MQRADFPELQGRPRTRHRRQDKPDRVLILLKFATLVVACGLVAVVILITGGTDQPRPAAAPPRIPTGQTGDDAPRTTTTVPTTTAPPVIAPPALHTEVASITRAAPATTSSKAPKPPNPQNPPPNFAVIGHPCPEPGMWSVTADYQPAFCYGNSPPRWRKVF